MRFPWAGSSGKLRDSSGIERCFIRARGAAPVIPWSDGPLDGDRAVVLRRCAAPDQQRREPAAGL